MSWNSGGDQCKFREIIAVFRDKEIKAEMISRAVGAQKMKSGLAIDDSRVKRADEVIERGSLETLKKNVNV